MNRYIVIFSALLVIVVVAVGAVFLLRSGSPTQTPVEQGGTPLATYSVTAQPPAQPSAQSLIQSFIQFLIQPFTQSSSTPSTSGTQPSTTGTQPSTLGTQPSTTGTQASTSGTQPSTTGTQPSTSGTQPPTSGTQSSTTTVVRSSAQSKEAVQAAFQSYMAPYNNDNIKLYETVIAGGYALQDWAGDNTGGEGLLKYDIGAGGWVVLTGGGGAWSVDGLVAAGVPRDTATTLLAGMPQ